jgi:hypothetical protein
MSVLVLIYDKNATLATLQLKLKHSPKPACERQGGQAGTDEFYFNLIKLNKS